MKSLDKASSDIRYSIMSKLDEYKKQKKLIDNPNSEVDDEQYRYENIWDEFPVSPTEFCVGADFMNDRTGTIWPSVRHDMEVIFSGTDIRGKVDYSPACNTYINCSGLGSGKSFTISVMMCYITYWLHCLKDPHAYFGMHGAGTTLLLMGLAPTEQKAKKIIYQKVNAMIRSIPWFRDRGYLPDPRNKNQMIFYKLGRDPSDVSVKELGAVTPFLNIRYGAGKAQAVVGEDLFAGIVDEACSPGGFELKDGRDRCEDIFETMHTRRISRFDTKGINMFISSAGTEGRWMEQRLFEIEEYRKKYDIPKDQKFIQMENEYGEKSEVITYAVRRPSFHCNPKYKGKKTFHYSFSKTTEKGVDIHYNLDIPIDFRRTMEVAPEKFLRDICAVPTMAFQPYFTNWNKVLDNVNKERVDPLPDNGKDNVMPVFTKEDGTLGAWDLLPDWLVGKSGTDYFCFPAGTEVMCAGLKRKNIEDIVVGDRVYTHKGNVKNVKKLFQHEHHGGFVKIKTQSGHNFECTNDHKILSLKRKKYCCGSQKAFHYPGSNHYKLSCDYKENIPKYEAEWIESKNLEEGDFLVMPRNIFDGNIDYWDGYDLNADLGYIVGWWIAEGCYRKKKKTKERYNLQFTVHTKEMDVLDKLKEKILKIHPEAEFSIYYHPTVKAMHLSCRNIQKLVDWMYDNLGEYSGGKFISTPLMIGNANFHLNLLKAYLDGDGYKNSFTTKDNCISNSVYGSTNSRHLGDCLYFLFLKYNFVPFGQDIKKKRNKNGKLTNKQYRVGIAGYKQMFRLYGETFENKMRQRLFSFFDKNYFYIPIKKIEKSVKKEIVYDFEVEDDHSFLVSGGIVVHNCHIDLGTGGTESSGNDAAGLCVAHRGPYVEREGEMYPTVVVDLSIRFKASKKKMKTSKGISTKTIDEIEIQDVREFVIALDRERGFKFAKVTYDGFGSLESLQILRKLGYEADREACTKDTWDNCRSLWYDGRIDIYKDDWLLYEMSKLEDKGSYVEHSVGHHDDEAQAMARAVELAIENCVPFKPKPRARPVCGMALMSGGSMPRSMASGSRGLVPSARDKVNNNKGGSRVLPSTGKRQGMGYFPRFK